MKHFTRVTQGLRSSFGERGSHVLGMLGIALSALLSACVVQTTGGPVPGTTVRAVPSAQASGFWLLERSFSVQIENLTPFSGELIALQNHVVGVAPGQTVQGSVRVPHDGQRLPLAFRVSDQNGRTGVATANPRTHRPSSGRRSGNHTRWSITCRDIAWDDGRQRRGADYPSPEDRGVVQVELPYNLLSGVTAVQVVNVTPYSARLFRGGQLEGEVPPGGLYYLEVRAFTYDQRRLPARSIDLHVQFIDPDAGTLAGVLSRERSYRLVTRDATPQLSQLVLTPRSVTAPR